MTDPLRDALRSGWQAASTRNEQRIAEDAAVRAWCAPPQGEFAPAADLLRAALVAYRRGDRDAARRAALAAIMVLDAPEPKEPHNDD